jgi:hypothetical protein
MSATASHDRQGQFEVGGHVTDEATVDLDGRRSAGSSGSRYDGMPARSRCQRDASRRFSKQTSAAAHVVHGASRMTCSSEPIGVELEWRSSVLDHPSDGIKSAAGSAEADQSVKNPVLNDTKQPSSMNTTIERCVVCATTSK